MTMEVTVGCERDPPADQTCVDLCEGRQRKEMVTVGLVCLLFVAAGLVFEIISL